MEHAKNKRMDRVISNCGMVQCQSSLLISQVVPSTVVPSACPAAPVDSTITTWWISPHQGNECHPFLVWVALPKRTSSPWGTRADLVTFNSPMKGMVHHKSIPLAWCPSKITRAWANFKVTTWAGTVVSSRVEVKPSSSNRQAVNQRRKRTTYWIRWLCTIRTLRPWAMVSETPRQGRVAKSTLKGMDLNRYHKLQLMSSLHSEWSKVF